MIRVTCHWRNNQTDMTRILLGALQPGARAIGIGITGARRGTANFGGQHRGVIVKGGTADELAAECFCALLANDLHVKAPECGLVRDPDNGAILFASIDVQTPNLMQALGITQQPTSAELRALANELAGWLGFGRLLALDVLMRNADRNAGNLLTDGVDWWAIDHARSLNLFPWNGHPLYRLVCQTCNTMVGAGVEASAVSNALTFSSGCHILTEQDLVEVGLPTQAARFASQIVARLPQLAATMSAKL